MVKRQFEKWVKLIDTCGLPGKFTKIVGTTTTGRQGLGYKDSKRSSEKEKILHEVRNEDPHVCPMPSWLACYQTVTMIQDHFPVTVSHSNWYVCWAILMPCWNGRGAGHPNSFLKHLIVICEQPLSGPAYLAPSIMSFPREWVQHSTFLFHFFRKFFKDTAGHAFQHRQCYSSHNFQTLKNVRHSTILHALFEDVVIVGLDQG